MIEETVELIAQPGERFPSAGAAQCPATAMWRHCGLAGSLLISRLGLLGLGLLGFGLLLGLFALFRGGLRLLLGLVGVLSCRHRCISSGSTLTLEELDGSLVPFRSRSCGEGTEVAAFPGLRIELPRVQPILAGFEFADHGGSCSHCPGTASGMGEYAANFAPQLIHEPAGSVTLLNEPRPQQ